MLLLVKEIDIGEFYGVYKPDIKMNLKIVDDFYNHKMIKKSEMKTVLDDYVRKIVFIYNFYFDENLKYIKEKDYINKMTERFLEHFKINDETLNDFKYIYDTLNIVYNQEKEANTRSYRTFVNNYSGVDQNQFKTFYPIFVREYAHLIILLNNDLHPETDICKESDICEEYISAAEKYKFEADSKVLSIINKK